MLRMLRAEGTRLRLAAQAELRAEAAATDNFSLTAEHETALFGLQYLAHLGIIDELCSELLDGEAQGMRRAACECVLQEEEVSEETAASFQEAIYALVNQARGEFSARVGGWDPSDHYLGLVCAARTFYAAGCQNLYPQLESEWGVWGFAACETASAISLLRGPAEADAFICDLAEYVSALKPGLSDVRHQMALPRALPTVFSSLVTVTCELSNIIEMRELACQAWRRVPATLAFSPLQQEAFAEAVRAAEGEVDSKKIDECCRRLEEQFGVYAPRKGEPMGLSSGPIDSRMSRNLIFLLRSLKNPEVDKTDWTCVLIGAQGLLASGYDQARYETCLQETLDVATRLGDQDQRPALDDLESLFDIPLDSQTPGASLSD